ncbi:MAG: beta-lactamase family protein [Gemmatimonadetes bacterium]|nr:beta-lactamase family protein [Gemmatimonadota bacterium]
MRVSTVSVAARVTRLLLVSLALAAWAPASALPQPYGQPSYMTPIAKRYEAAIVDSRTLLSALMEEQGIPGLSVAVAVGGEIVWSEGFGYANVEHRIPVTPITKFRSGSIAKAMTGTGLAVLVERGQIDLDAPVRKYVPQWPEKHPTITIRQLAGHLSGIRHYDPQGEEFFNKKRYTDLVDALEYFKDNALLFQPGSKYSYSSYGFNLLGMAMQRAGGKPYVILMHENVFEPLGMRSTVGDHSDTIIAYRVSFYERSGGGSSYHTRKTGWNSKERTLLNGPFADNSYKHPGGGFLTTPEDLVRLGSAILQPGFLKAQTLALLLTPMRTAAGEETGYGMGWRIAKDERGHRTIGHGGGAVGGTSSLVVYPDQKVVVAIQVNLTDVEYGEVPERLAWLFMGPGATGSGGEGAERREQ